MWKSGTKVRQMFFNMLLQAKLRRINHMTKAVQAMMKSIYWEREYDGS